MYLYELRKVALERKARGYAYRLCIDSLTIAPGEKIALLGPSGCGKSTALDLLAMILQPDEAETFRLRTDEGEQDVAAMWRGGRRDRMADLRLRHIGYVLQTGGLLPFLTGAGNIVAPGKAQGMDAGAIRHRLAELGERLGITHVMGALPDKMSIGERQRVAIARALLAGPRLVLADEPTAALDPVSARNVMRLFTEAAASCALVVVSHDERLVQESGLRVLRMDARGEGNRIQTILRG